ncbi:HAD superfamily hydrolase (TIGR01509 family) [Agromyces cerinus]|uniref:HAD family hydrolase n=1 Tax=Agromyces cerinus TaxID=33878 RepID=UPI00195845D8|nr:HAD-IA family hydrolase [Agromyces cerinus]MBM7830742.1 HAD superfamily hydrolase (TIGR01509 family) [Agromyces cerinus]
MSPEARPPHRHPRAVLLDFHGTLAVARSVDEWIADARTRVPHDVDPSAGLSDRIRNVWADAGQRFPTLDWDLDPTSHRHAFVSTISRDDRVSTELAEALYETMPQQWMLNAGAAAFIARASDIGMPLAVVSNIALDVRPALQRWGLASAFDAVILSYEVGYAKPDPRIFRLASDSLGVDPRHCVMIGDSSRDDGGAAALGMQCMIARPEQMHRAFELALPS